MTKDYLIFGEVILFCVILILVINMKKKQKTKTKKAKEKEPKITIIEINDNTIKCNDGDYHNLLYISFEFGNKKRFVQKCSKCKRMFVDKQKFIEYQKDIKDVYFTKDLLTYKEKQAYLKKKEQERKKTKIVTKKLRICIVDNLNVHRCKNINIIERTARVKGEKYVVNYCLGCGEFYTTKSTINRYDKIKSKIEFVDMTAKAYDRMRREEEVDRLLKYNLDQFIAKEKLPKKAINNNPGVNEKQYFDIISKIKKENRSDFLVKGNTYYCKNRNHKIFELKANIDIVLRDGSIVNESCPAYYCDNCEIYYIYEHDYERLKNRGSILCKIYDSYKFSSINNQAYVMNSESLLHSFGYNVNGIENLSTLQRQMILKLLIDNNIMSKYEIINHINYLINRSLNLKNFAQARSRWKEDLNFLSDFKKSEINKRPTLMTRIQYIKKDN